MGDAPVLRYASPKGDTRDAMRDWLRNTEEGLSLYNHGDCRLVWVNEGDLYQVQLRADIAAAREAELLAEVERLKSAMDEGNAAYVAVYDDRARLRALLDEARASGQKKHRRAQEAEAGISMAEWQLEMFDCYRLEAWLSDARATLAKIGAAHD
jgi:hypothetical protein